LLIFALPTSVSASPHSMGGIPTGNAIRRDLYFRLDCRNYRIGSEFGSNAAACPLELARFKSPARELSISCIASYSNDSQSGSDGKMPGRDFSQHFFQPVKGLN
jgi:hypothetical protein